MKNSKICGISDLTTLNYIINHPYSPKYIGFIVNFLRSPRFVKFDKLTELLNVDKKNCKFTAVLVKPNLDILEKIKDLPFDYYQIYDCKPDEIYYIKKKYNKMIITAFTIKSSDDLKEFNLYDDVSDIFLFDSKGYEKSMSFEHKLIKDIKFDKEVMLAGNVQINDELENYKKIADIIDISGGVETYGKKDIYKIEIFLKKIEEMNDEARRPACEDRSHDGHAREQHA